MYIIQKPPTFTLQISLSMKNKCRLSLHFVIFYLQSNEDWSNGMDTLFVVLVASEHLIILLSYSINRVHTEWHIYTVVSKYTFSTKHSVWALEEIDN